MRPKFSFSGLLASWRSRRMHALVRAVSTPNREELEEMIHLLDLTDKHAHVWPTRWSPNWFRQLAQSDSWNANNLCCTTKLDRFSEDFNTEMALYGLRSGNIPLFEWFMAHLDARRLPKEMWILLLSADPIIQLRCLVKLPHLDELEGDSRQPVLAMLAGSEPHFWLYDHALWYTTLSRKWRIAPPAPWWHLLYTLNLHRPPNISRNLVQHYRGSTVNQIFKITGKTTYSDNQLCQHRSAILSQDRWAVVRSAFYGDTQMWPPRPTHDQQAIQMYVDAYTILMQYNPSILQTAFQDLVPESVRDATPRVEFMMFLGMPSGPEAAAAFTSWLDANGGELTPARAPETFALDNLL